MFKECLNQRMISSSLKTGRTWNLHSIITSLIREIWIMKPYRERKSKHRCISNNCVKSIAWFCHKKIYWRLRWWLNYYQCFNTLSLPYLWNFYSFLLSYGSLTLWIFHFISICFNCLTNGISFLRISVKFLYYSFVRNGLHIIHIPEGAVG